MLPHKINAKLFVEEPAAINLPEFIPVFHRWIQERAVEGLLIDVANYAHVPKGPGVLLVGHEGDYSIDLRDGRPGLRYSRKREWEDEATEPAALQQRLRTVLRLALLASQTIEEERAFEGRITFRTDEVELTFADRLQAPNEPETLDKVRASLEAVLAELYPGTSYALERASDDPRRPFTLRVRVATAPPLASLVAASERVGVAA